MGRCLENGMPTALRARLDHVAIVRATAVAA
jgi:hypothetical protein